MEGTWLCKGIKQKVGVDKMLNKLCRYVRRCIIILIKWVMPVFPIKKDQICFMNFYGRGFGDNPKYICEELHRQYPELKLYWLSNKEDGIPQYVKYVRFRSLKSYYILATARVWVDNVRFSKGVHKKSGQYYIQTWHASHSQKRLEHEAEDKIGKLYIRQAKRDGKITDLMISNSKMQSEDFRNNFWYKGEIMECGAPRNDFLISNKNNTFVATEIKRKLGILDDRKIILFAPTFRDNEDNSYYALDFKLLKQAAEKHYNQQCVVLVRWHPNVADRTQNIKFVNGVINVSEWPDMQELILICDLLITDYSSSIFDAMIIDKEVVIYAPDLEEYNQTRGLRDFFWKLPFPIYETQQIMFDELPTYHSDVNLIERFQDWYGSYDKGNASSTVAQRIGNVIQRSL